MLIFGVKIHLVSLQFAQEVPVFVLVLSINATPEQDPRFDFFVDAAGLHIAEILFIRAGAASSAP